MANNIPEYVEHDIEKLIIDFEESHVVPELRQIKKALPKDCANITDRIYNRVKKNRSTLLYTVAFVRCFDIPPLETLTVIYGAFPSSKKSFEWFSNYLPRRLYRSFQAQQKGSRSDLESWASTRLDFSSDPAKY